ncbi:MAG: hypothetical protein JWQ09_4129, partial [Segetibacter sp.]|nr:hypothetical protein [Segetibacter sp.]
MRVTKIICGENVIRDAETGQITVYNLLDDISSPSYPLLIPRFSIYFFSEREDDEEPLQFITLSILINGDLLFKDRVQINFKNKN